VIKSLTYKVLSVLMALLVMFSTLSFTVESHYCGNHLVDTAIFTEAKKCGDSETKPKPCCKDEIEVVKGQDTLDIKTINDLDFNLKVFVNVYEYYFINLYESLPKRIIPHKDYSPPNLIEDIQLLDAVFLI